LPAAVQSLDVHPEELRVAEGVWQALQFVPLSAQPLLQECWPAVYSAATAAHEQLLRQQALLRWQQEQEQRR
jgi:hypothetical protein